MQLLSSLREKLVFWTVTMEALLLLVFAALLVFAVQKTQNDQIDDVLKLGSSQLNAVVDIQGGQYEIPAADKVALSSKGIVAWVLTPEGKVANTVGNADAIPLPLNLSNLDQLTDSRLPNDEPVRFLTTLLHEGSHNLGTLVLGLSLRGSQDLTRQILISLSIAIPVVLVLSAAGGLFLANRALYPVAAITRTARQLSAADLSQRLGLNLPQDEIGELALTFDAMLERLDRAFQRERQLTSDVSHELRTPLAMLKTQLSLARSRPRDAVQLLQMMTDMEGDVDRMTRLIEQMLTLARIEQHELLPFAPVVLRTLLDDVSNRFQAQAAERQVHLCWQNMLSVDIYVSGNQDQLQQVFSNLVENAIKHTLAAGQVTIQVESTAQIVSVKVCDTGVGIAAEHLPHVFERFYRVDNARTRETGGFGLGLSIADAIVKAHGGSIQIESIVGQGTTFTVTLPLFTLKSPV